MSKTNKPKLDIAAFEQAIGDIRRDIRPAGGITANELSRDTGISRSTARYHLDQLVRSGRATIEKGRYNGQSADFYVLVKCGTGAKKCCGRKCQPPTPSRAAGLPTVKPHRRVMGFGLPVSVLPDIRD